MSRIRQTGHPDRQARLHCFSRVQTLTLRAAKRDVVVVTRNGRPVAAIQAIDDDDLEDLLLERSRTFWEMIRRARQGRPISLSVVRRRLGRPRRERRRR